MTDEQADISRVVLPADGSSPRYVSWLGVIPTAAATGLFSWLCIVAWAHLCADPNGFMHSFGDSGPVNAPTILHVLATTPLVILGIWGCATLLARRKPGPRRPYAGTLRFLASAASVLVLGSAGALIFATDPGPILKMSGNLAAVCTLLLLLVAKMRSIDSSDGP